MTNTQQGGVLLSDTMVSFPLYSTMSLRVLHTTDSVNSVYVVRQRQKALMGSPYRYMKMWGMESTIWGAVCLCHRYDIHLVCIGSKILYNAQNFVGYNKVH